MHDRGVGDAFPEETNIRGHLQTIILPGDVESHVFVLHWSHEADIISHAASNTNGNQETAERYPG